MVSRHKCICVDESNPEKDHRMMGKPTASEAPPTDFFPSVGLASLLVLIFLSVVYILFSEGGGCGRTIPLGFVGEKAVHLHPLIPSQSRATWWTLENSLKPNRKGVTTVIAVSRENAVQTLICFSSKVISLLSVHSSAHNVTKRLQDGKLSRSLWLSNAVYSRTFHVAVLTRRKGQSPYGVILGPAVHLAVGESPWEMTLTVQNMETKKSQHDEAYGLANQVMKLLYTTGRISETFELGSNEGESLPILQITGDPYLESGFVC